jgi:8-oxo-dGTP diphosphatase
MKKADVQIFQTQPQDFVPKVHVGASYVVVNGKILMLQLSSHKKEGGSWGVPAGKIDLNETPEQGARRELLEETGISLASHSHMQSIGQLYIRKPDMDYVYHMFKVQLERLPEILLSNEHQAYKWISSHEVQSLQIMEAGREPLEQCYKKIVKKERSGAALSVYLIVRKNDQILLLLRKNTGYGDGLYGLVSGHVEDGESATDAIIREANEEAGIELVPSQLKVVHVMHSKTNRQNIEIFFECKEWKGTITNKEPEKCGALEFYLKYKLPSNMVEQVEKALQAIERGEIYSELGWI